MRIVPLTCRGRLGRFTILDDDDFAWAISTRWRYQLTRRGRRYGYHYICKPAGFAGESGNYLHRALMLRLGHALDGFAVDHANGWRLDNRRQNLRVIGPGRHRRGARRNIHNVGGKGWQVRVGRTLIGTYMTKGEAEAAYEDAAAASGLITPSVEAQLQKNLIVDLDGLVANGHLICVSDDAEILEDRYSYILPESSKEYGI